MIPIIPYSHYYWVGGPPKVWGLGLGVGTSGVEDSLCKFPESGSKLCPRPETLKGGGGEGGGGEEEGGRGVGEEVTAGFGGLG